MNNTNESGFGVINHFGTSNSKMTARFYWDAVIDSEATLKEGRTIYKDAPHVLLTCDGGKRQIPKRATPQLISKYSNEFKAFENEVKRMPLWILHLKPYQIKELEHLDIRCVEDLATHECPVEYEKYKQAAKIINQLRQDHEESTIDLQSTRNNQTERENVRIEEVQREQNISDRSRTKETQKENQQEVQREQNISDRSRTKETQKENQQEVILEYNWQLS